MEKISNDWVCKKKSSKEKSMMYLCAYYYLKDAGWFPDAAIHFPSQKEIYNVLVKESVDQEISDISELLDYLGIPYSYTVLSTYRRARKRIKRKTKKTEDKKVGKKSERPKIKHLSKTLYKKSSVQFFASDKWKALRYRVLEKYGATCQCCGRSYRVHGVVMHVDHIIPRSIRPDLALDIDNLQVLCEECNLGKSNKFATDWRNDG